MTEHINGSEPAPLSNEHALLIVNAGFTERFMDGVRERSPKGGHVWRNPQTGVRLPHPLDVTRRDPNAEGTILARLKSFCDDKPIPYVWTLDKGEGGAFACRIGVHQGDGQEATLLGNSVSASFGFCIAMAMLQAAGHDFDAARRELIEDAPRIQLSG